MSEIIVKNIAAEEVSNEHIYLERVFTIDDKEIIGHVDRQSLNPLRFLAYELAKKNIKIHQIISGNDPWDIEQLRIEYSEYEEIEKLLKEIMEYRCHTEFDLDDKVIIRQLPFKVLMKTSDNIMNYGKSQEEHIQDKRISNICWSEIADYVERTMGYSYACKYRTGNPNGTIDNITISQSEPEKRMHLIYRSGRGGYNIKTRGYDDSTLDHYCFRDSHQWD